MSRLGLISVLFAGLLAIAGLAAYALIQATEWGAPIDGPSVAIGEAVVGVEVVREEAARERGLSGREKLAANMGMLFVFPRDGALGFWMKDMHFSIDIIWISSLYTVVHIQERVHPETYPTVFSSDTPARYVLEVHEGWVEDHAIEVGDAVDLRI
jgi:hypothetical protein